MVIRYLASVLLFITAFLNCSLGQSFKSEMYYQEDGLPNDLVKSIAIDSIGFVWVATDDGIVKMLGKDFLPVQLSKAIAGNFKQLLFTHKYGLVATSDGGIYSITEDFMGAYAKPFSKVFSIKSWEKVIFPKTIYESKDNSLWFGGAWDVFHLINDSVVRYDLPEKNFTEHFSRNAQFFEIAGKFFVLTQPGYLYELHLDSNTFSEVEFLGSGIPVYDALRFSQHGVMVANDRGLIIIDFLENGSIKTDKWIYEMEAVSKIEQLSPNEFLIGTWDRGLKRLWRIGDSYSVQVFPVMTPGTINDIEIGADEQCWIGTDVGLQFVRRVPFGRKFENLTADYIQDILILKGEQMYFSDGNKVYFYDLRKDLLNVFHSAEEGLILRICEYDGGIAMSTSLGKVIIKYPSNNTRVLDFTKEGRGIYSMQRAKGGDLWFIQERGESQPLIRWNDKLGGKIYTGSLDDNSRLSMIKISEQGKMYVGGFGADTYLFQYDEDQDSLINISHTVELNSDRTFAVLDMVFERDDKITLATEFGVWEWNENEIVQLNLNQLTNVMASAVCRDSLGGLWIANSHGLLQYKDKAFQIFDNDDGMPSKSIPYRTLKSDYENRLWFGTIAGLGKGVVTNLKHVSSSPIISSFRVSGVTINFENNIQFLDTEILGFKIASPAYPSKHIKYRYKLSNGVEGDWIDIRPGDNELLLSSLATGKYELSIKACDIGFYTWSKPSLYKFNIYKVWYERTWVLFLFYMIVLLIVGFYIFYVRWKNEKERLALEEVISDRTKSLQERNEELISLNEALNTANENAEEAVNTKDKFFSIIAHDLKSPFNALIGISDLLTNQNGNLPKETVDRLLKEMHDTSENTYKLLQNLLDWARSQTGNITVHYENVMMADLLAEAIESVESNAKQKEIQITTTVEEGLNFQTDMVLLSTVLRNLLSNAIKFSEPGSKVELIIQQQENTLNIFVKDSGIGIEPERMINLFSLGGSRSTAGTANEKGTGLGLLLSYEFVTKLEGNIAVNSIPSLGTEFLITLPKRRI